MGSPPAAPRERWWLKDLWGCPEMTRWFESRQGSKSSSTESESAAEEETEMITAEEEDTEEVTTKSPPGVWGGKENTFKHFSGKYCAKEYFSKRQR